MDSTTTMAQVAKEALELTKNGLVQLIDTLKDAAPELWRIAMRQVIVEAVIGLAGALFAVTVVIILLRWVYRHWMQFRVEYKEKHHQYPCLDASGWGVGLVLLWIVFGLTGIITTIIAASSVTVLLNPEYYAAKLLLAMAGIQ